MPALSIHELATEHAELLPRREALQLVKINLADIWASNSALALNAASVNSAAAAAATQSITVTQS